jgi:hypothetical protein
MKCGHHAIMQSEHLPLVLTLQLDRQTFQYFDQLRQQHFPAERNFLPAHITLFHSLPGEQEVVIAEVLKECCQHTMILPLLFSKPRFLGKGVAIDIDAPALLQLHYQLVKRWDKRLHTQLTQQDRQGYRPHLTIQNKVAPDTARSLYERLVRDWHPLEGEGQGLLLWRYLGGPWELIEEFNFVN